MDSSVYLRQRLGQPNKMWFGGSTAIKKGMALCHNWDYTSSTVAGNLAADASGTRCKYVEVPTTSNNMYFAGVAAHDQAAAAQGQFVDVYEPGQIAEIAVGMPTTLQATRLTFTAGPAGAYGAGRFVVEGLSGRGTAVALQTLAAGAAVTATNQPGTVPASLLTGGSAASTATITLSDAAKDFTALGVAAGDIVVIVGGEAGTVGEYVVATAGTTTLTTTVTMGTFTAGVHYYIIRGNPTILAYLQDGEESGGVEFLNLNNGGAVVAMVGGTTYACGNNDLASSATFVLADGAINGLRKQFQLTGTVSTGDFVVTVTSGILMAGTALGTLTFDGAGDFWMGQWYGSIGGQSTGAWRSIVATGVAET